MTILGTRAATFAHKAVARAQKSLLKNELARAVFKLANRNEPEFQCPICDYRGPFVALYRETKLRDHAACPGCGAAERHRLQYVIMRRVAESFDFGTKAILHVAPEPFFRDWFRRVFASYTSVDLHRRNVDHRADLRALPFPDASYDCVFASHVLEHIREDALALAEIRRVLRPGGIAVIPVPIVAAATIEYPAPNPHEEGHVRAPGLDYYQKYSKYFRQVDLYRSDDFPERYQLFIYEDRTSWPTTMPLRPVMDGARHGDVVPVCVR